MEHPIFPGEPSKQVTTQPEASTDENSAEMDETIPRCKMFKVSNSIRKSVSPSHSELSSDVIEPNAQLINTDSNEVCALKKGVNKRVYEEEEEMAEEKPKNETKENENVPEQNLELEDRLHSPVNTPPRSITCGVCGAVWFYQFVEQARMFNIYCCGLCRKFISKMIKRLNDIDWLDKWPLVCYNGLGMCHITPIVYSQQRKLLRCSACWLKMCLRSFKMPVGLCHRLVQVLPKNMQIYNLPVKRSLPVLLRQSTPTNGGEASTSSEEIPLSLPSTSKDNKENDIADKQCAVQLSPIKEDNKPPAIPRIPRATRQTINRKGPRVKHVCRSAAMVLGHPIATFPLEPKRPKYDDRVDDEKAEKENKIVLKDDEKVNIDNTVQCSGSIRSENNSKLLDTEKSRSPKTVLAASASGSNNNAVPEVIEDFYGFP